MKPPTPVSHVTHDAGFPPTPRTEWCQLCIEYVDDLRLSEIHGRRHWICGRCAEPMPRASYDLSDPKRNKRSHRRYRRQR